MALVGGTLLGQSRYAEAEPLLVAGYQGLQARAPSIPFNGKYYLTEAAERLVRLYGAWGKPKQARAWTLKLGLANLPTNVFAEP
jgi:eukaryotic-like serine/threonine-protein kinase